MFQLSGSAPVIDDDKKLLGRITVDDVVDVTIEAEAIGVKSDAMFDSLLEDSQNAADVKEVVAVANAKGISLKKQDIEFSMQAFMNSAPNTTASMQRDMMEGKPSELENFNGYIVNQGKLLGIETPTNAFIYHCLLPQEMKARS